MPSPSIPVIEHLVPSPSIPVVEPCETCYLRDSTPSPSLPPSLPPAPLLAPLSSPHRREPRSEQLLFESATDPLAPKISFVSTVVNQPVIQPFLFTNYRHHPSQEAAAHYQSCCDVKIWEAIMASTAAPGYFEEVKLGKCVHQVGTAWSPEQRAVLWYCGSQILT